MIDGWTKWMDKKVFLRTTNGRVYTGIVKEADQRFISLIDKFGLWVTVSVSDIVEIKEDGQ